MVKSIKDILYDFSPVMQGICIEAEQAADHMAFKASHTLCRLCVQELYAIIRSEAGYIDTFKNYAKLRALAVERGPGLDFDLYQDGLDFAGVRNVSALFFTLTDLLPRIETQASGRGEKLSQDPLLQTIVEAWRIASEIEI